MNRQNNGIAPHAKGESSPSPSISENSDVLRSIRKIDSNSPQLSGAKGQHQYHHQHHHKSTKKQSNSDVYVINKSEFDSGNEKTVTSIRSEYHHGNDNVDCSSPTAIQSSNVFKMESTKWMKTQSHPDDTIVHNTEWSSSSPSSSAANTSAKTDESTSVENCLSLPTSPTGMCYTLKF